MLRERGRAGAPLFILPSCSILSLLNSGAVASGGQAGWRVKASSTQVPYLVETGVRQVDGRGMLR